MKVKMCLFLVLFSVGFHVLHADLLLKVSIKGAIGPPVVQLLENVHQKAQDTKADAILIKLDTPGGLAESMRQINQQILASEIPYILYVYPKGARAASAGTFMLYAAHVAAMAPTTTLGAASPVSMFGGGSNPADPNAKDEKTQSNQDTMMKKVTNDAVASIRSLAKLRGRNADWAEAAVREAKSLSATEALEKGVIDLVAEDEADLIQQLKTRSIKLNEKAKPKRLNIVESDVYEPSLKETFLMALINPNLLYIFALLGIYGIIFEFSSPGVGLPGAIGVVCLLLAGFGLQMLPINAFGIAMLVVGAVFLGYELITPSFGIFGSIGVLLLALSGWFLLDSSVTDLTVDPSIIAVAILGNILGIAFLVYVVMQSKGKHVKCLDSLVGIEGQVLVSEGQTGLILIQGERWKFRSKESLKEGDTVKVSSQEGLVLDVGFDTQ